MPSKRRQQLPNDGGGRRDSLSPVRPPRSFPRGLFRFRTHERAVGASREETSVAKHFEDVAARRRFETAQTRRLLNRQLRTRHLEERSSEAINGVTDFTRTH